jgi:hypothetical protein
MNRSANGGDRSSLLHAGIHCRYPPRQFSALFAGDTATVQSLESGHFGLSHAILLKSEFRFRLRLGSACENHADSPSGQSRAFMQGRPSANQYLAGSRSHAARRAQRHQTRRDHSLPPESVSIETQFGKPQSGLASGFPFNTSPSASSCCEAAGPGGHPCEPAPQNRNAHPEG